MSRVITENIIDPLIEYLINNSAAVIAFQPREVMNCLIKLAGANASERLLLMNIPLISDLRWIFNSQQREKTFRDKSWQKQVSNILYGGKKEIQQSQVYHLGDVCKLSSQALKKLFKKAGAGPKLTSKAFLDKYFVGIDDFQEKITNSDIRVKITSSDVLIEDFDIEPLTPPPPVVVANL